MPPLDPYHGSRPSPIDEDNARERDVRLRPPRTSGGPFPRETRLSRWFEDTKRDLAAIGFEVLPRSDSERVTLTVDRDALNAAFLVAEAAADDEEGEDGPLARFIRQCPFGPTDSWLDPIVEEQRAAQALQGVSPELLADAILADETIDADELERFADRRRDLRDYLGETPRADRVFDESSPRHPDPRCKECGERLGDEDRAEVFRTGRVESAWNYGPFLVHADPCFTGHKEKYELA